MTEKMISSEEQVQVMYLDCTAHPRYSLVQGDQGTKARCTALIDISWFCDFVFPPFEGHENPVSMKVPA